MSIRIAGELVREARAESDAELATLREQVRVLREALMELIKHAPPTPADYNLKHAESFSDFEFWLIGAQNQARAILATDTAKEQA